MKSDIAVQTKTRIGPFVGRDSISIMLKAVAPDVKPIPNRTRHEWAPSDAYISTAEPDVLFEEYRSKGVAFSKAIDNNSDDLRGFEIEDAMAISYFSDGPVYNNQLSTDTLFQFQFVSLFDITHTRRRCYHGTP